MQKVIHQSWANLAEAAPAASLVALDFEGEFATGSYQGERFAGRISYDRETPPSERHVSFALYENWPAPIVTMVIGGQVLTADGAAVYDSVVDGNGSHYDFVNLFGSSAFHEVAEMAHFELFFADEDAAALDGTALPPAQILCDLPVKHVSFSTNEPGNVTSRGALRLVAAEGVARPSRLAGAARNG